MPVSAARVLRAIAGEEQTDAELLGQRQERRLERVLGTRPPSTQMLPDLAILIHDSRRPA